MSFIPTSSADLQITEFKQQAKNNVLFKLNILKFTKKKKEKQIFILDRYSNLFIK